MRLILLIIKSPFYFIRSLYRFFRKDMNGVEFEEYVCRLLKKNGFKNVTLTKKSHDYGIDILAKKKKKTYAFQCKYYSKPVGVAAIQQVYAGCEYYGYDIPVVITNQTYTRQAVTLARSNGVVLWDGHDLKSLMRKARFYALFQHKDVETKHPYEDVLYALLEEGYASNELLMEHFDYTQEKAFYILDDLQFCDLVSQEDSMGIRDLYFESFEEALSQLK